MQLIAPNFNDWFESKSGSATINLTHGGKVATMTAGAVDRAFLVWPMMAGPGDSISLTVMARASPANGGELIIDSPNGTGKNSLKIDSEDWKPYTIQYTIPLTGDQAVTGGIGEIAVGVGVGSASVGTVEVQNPHIELINGSTGAMRVLATATLETLGSGVVRIYPGVTSFGFKEPVVTAGKIHMDLLTPVDFSRGSGMARFPDVQISAGASGQNGDPIIWGYSTANLDDGSFDIYGYYTKSGTLVTNTAAIGNRYIRVTVLAV